VRSAGHRRKGTEEKANFTGSFPHSRRVFSAERSPLSFLRRGNALAGFQQFFRVESGRDDHEVGRSFRKHSVYALYGLQQENKIVIRPSPAPGKKQDTRRVLTSPGDRLDSIITRNVHYGITVKASLNA